MLDHEKQQLFDAMLEQVGTEIENDELRIELQKSQDETLIAHALGQNKANRALELTKEAEAREMVAHSDRVKTARELEERHAKEMAAANEAAKVTTEAAIKAVTKPVGILLSELIAKRLNKIRATTTQKKTYAVWYEQLLEIVGDIPITDIAHIHAIKYSDAIKALPSNQAKGESGGKSIAELLTLKTPAEKEQSSTTINNKIRAACALFAYAIGAGHLTANPFADKELTAMGESIQREPFTEDDLKKLFSGNIFKKKRFRNSYTYWLIPLALLTGARLNELCQLDLADFVEMESKDYKTGKKELIHCISINGEYELRGKVVAVGTKKVKNKQSIRHIPIHPFLIDLGLIEHVESLKAKGEKRLFPELTWNEKSGYGKQPSKWFGDYGKACGTYKKNTKVFHSFRHTFAYLLKGSDIPFERISAVLGHDKANASSTISKTTVGYGVGEHLHQSRQVLDALSLPEDILAMIPRLSDVIIAA